MDKTRRQKPEDDGSRLHRAARLSGGCGSGRGKEKGRKPSLARGNRPAATRASRKPRSHPSASSSRMVSRNSAAAAVTPFSSSLRTRSCCSEKKNPKLVKK